jgi:superfamily II DNA or RNA helicase
MSDLLVSYFKGNRCRFDVTHEYFSIIREHFSYDDPTARFSRGDNIPSRKYIISKVGYMDIGMLWDVMRLVKINNWGFELKISTIVKSKLVNPLKIPICEVPNQDLKNRDYQLASIVESFKVGHGLIVVGTGGGKSLILASMMESIYQSDNNAKMILVVPDVGLVNQMYKDFTDYECSYSFSKWKGGDELDPTSNVVIVHTKFLQTFNKMQINEFDSFFEGVDYLFHDEVHLFNSTTGSIPKASKLLNSYTYEHKFGMTGSMHKDGFTKDKIVGFFGTPIYEKGSKELRDEKYLSEVDIKLVRFVHNDPMSIYKFDKETHATEDYNLEIDHVVNSEFRNNWIEKVTNMLTGNVLVLVERIEQGEIMLERLQRTTNKQVFFIRGSMKGEERQRIIAEMEINDDIVCIAMSKIFSTGISVKNLPYIIFAYLGKAWHKTIQAVGRGLRLHDRKDKLRLFDLYDNLMYSSEHAEARKKIYNDQELEYKEYKIDE